MKSKIFYVKPSVTQVEIDFVLDAAANGWGEHCYDYIERFENKFKDYLGVKHVLATSSCTGAMHLGLAGLKISPGDEIILADLNWIATVSPIVHLMAKPVLIDVLPDSWCLDPFAVKRAISKRTKAIIATHLYGNLCELHELLQIGQKYGIPVIEDAAEALGSYYDGRPAGSFGVFSTFSFHGSKTITTGEGGIFATNNTELFNRVLTLSNHGRKQGEKRQFWSERVGYKFKMANIQAAIGYGQMTRFNELIDKKRLVFSWYKERLKNLPLMINPEPAKCKNGYWMPTVIIDKEINFDREALLTIFKENNIDGRVFFWPLSLLGIDTLVKYEDNKISYDLYSRGVNLPSYHDMTEKEVTRVAECLKISLNRQT
ncbi:MAG: DegT/DnrJ/EryC1/StrS family aminotransferase [Deltaproteobacteria bacterium]|jgi:perosamine synthetase|nr:DegT/DnrJ/EryC1/StrS family aminotransferase [Deltaproteobacteria bacterium]